MIKKISFLLLTSLLLFTSIPVEAQEKPKVIYYVPHQDDEVISMGISILNHLKSGQDVHLVLLTDGGNSYIRKKNNTPRHLFKQARDNEFKKASSELGVKPQNIHFENLRDGELTKDQMINVIMKYENKFPNAKHKSLSYHDNHNDHRVSGEALNELYNDGKVSDARFYINRFRHDTPGRITKLKYGGEPDLRRAVRAYYVKNKALGLQGIGYQSAGSAIFSESINNPINIFHLPNE